MLCSVLLCFALLSLDLLCFALFCCALLCFALLGFALLCFAVLCFALLCFALLCLLVHLLPQGSHEAPRIWEGRLGAQEGSMRAPGSPGEAPDGSNANPMLCLLVRLLAIHGSNSILLAIERRWACFIASFCRHFSGIAPPERPFGGHGRAPGGPKEAPRILECKLGPTMAP